VTTHRYLVIGGGLTAHAAATAIRELDAGGSLAMIAAEPEPPYARPPLTKGLWKGKPEDSVFYPPVPGLVLLAGRRAVALDTRARTVRDGTSGSSSRPGRRRDASRSAATASSTSAPSTTIAGSAPWRASGSS